MAIYDPFFETLSGFLNSCILRGLGGLIIGGGVGGGGGAYMYVHILEQADLSSEKSFKTNKYHKAK